MQLHYFNHLRLLKEEVVMLILILFYLTLILESK